MSAEENVRLRALALAEAATTRVRAARTAYVAAERCGRARSDWAELSEAVEAAKAAEAEAWAEVGGPE